MPGAAGGMMLSGTPSKAGVFSFDVTCKDAQGETVTAHFVLVVQAKRVELAFEGGSFVYSGDAQAPEVTGVPKACEGDPRIRYYGTDGTYYSSSEAPTDAGTLNLFDVTGKRVAYRPKGSKSLFSNDGRWCGTVADASGGGFAFGVTRGCAGLF